MHFPCLQHGGNWLIFNYTFLILYFSSSFINEAEELGLRVQESDGATRAVFCFISLHSAVSPPWDTLPSGATISGCAGCTLRKGTWQGGEWGQELHVHALLSEVRVLAWRKK